MIRLVQGGVSEKVVEAMRNPKAPVAIPAVPAITEPMAVTPAVASIKVPDGLPILVALSTDVPLDAEPKTPLTFTVARDVVVNGKPVITRGAAAKGVVLNRTKRRLLIIGSKVLFQFSDVVAANGTHVKVRATPKPPEPDDAAGRPLEGSGGASKPKNVAASKGTHFTAYVSGEHEILLKK